LPLSLKSPIRLTRVLLTPYRRWHTRWVERRLIRRDPLYDFGAVNSIRERLAVGEHHHSNTWDDALKAVYVVQLDLTRALEEYLTKLDIDTTGLREDVKGIINNYRTYVHGITGTNIVIGVGQHGNTNVTLAAPPAGSATARPAGPTPTASTAVPVPRAAPAPAAPASVAPPPGRP